MFLFKKPENTKLQVRQSCPECGNQLPLSLAGVQSTCPCLSGQGEGPEDVAQAVDEETQLHEGSATGPVPGSGPLSSSASVPVLASVPVGASPPRTSLDRPGAVESSGPVTAPVDVGLLGIRSLKFLGTYGAIVMITTGVMGATAYLLIAWMLHECFGAKFEANSILLYLTMVPILVCIAACFLGYEIPPHGSSPTYIVRNWIFGLPKSFKEGIARALKIAAVEVLVVFALAASFSIVYARDIALTRFAVRSNVGASRANKASFEQLVRDEVSRAGPQELPVIKMIAGVGYRRWNDIVGKERCFREAINAYGDDLARHPGVEAIAHMNISEALAQQGRYLEAQGELLKALQVFDSQKKDVLPIPEIDVFEPFGHSHLGVGLASAISRVDVQGHLADVLRLKGDREASRQIYDKMSLANVRGFYFIDTSGSPISNAKFDETRNFSNGMAAVRIGEKWGFVDRTGKFVIYPSFDSPGTFHDGLAVVVDFKNGPTRTAGNNLAQIIDNAGNAIGQFLADEARPFSEGLAAVRIADKWGYVDRSGKMVIRPQFELAEEFSEGVALVCEADRYRFIDKLGNPAFDGTFDRARSFSEGLADVMNNDLHEFIDRSGRSRIQAVTLGNASAFAFMEDAGDFKGGLAPVKIKGMWGYIDRAGSLPIRPTFSKAYSFQDEMAVVEIPWSGLWLERHIDKTGKLVANEEAVSYARPFNDGLARAPDSDRTKVGFIDKDGRFRIKPEFDWATSDFSEGLASVREAR